VDSIYRILDQKNWPRQFVDQIFASDALNFIEKLPDECIALAVTSPPYWSVKDYEHPEQIGQTGYEQYLEDLLKVWQETERVLIPNGKLAIVAPIMPISKTTYNQSHTRHIKNISNDIEQTILKDTNLQRYSLFIWQKQTTVKMFGSYPYPPNIYEDNTIEFINVFVKQGKPPRIVKEAKEPSRLTQEEWRNLTMQVWPMYPADVKRIRGHPAPFPIVLPQRLIMMYTFRMAPEAHFAGDIVLDMFNGIGTSCLAARALRRHYIGVDLNSDYCRIAREHTNRRSFGESVDSHAILLEPVQVKSPQNSLQIDLLTGRQMRSAKNG
jgi:DNA modification methylase